MRLSGFLLLGWREEEDEVKKRRKRDGKKGESVLFFCVHSFYIGHFSVLFCNVYFVLIDSLQMAVLVDSEGGRPFVRIWVRTAQLIVTAAFLAPYSILRRLCKITLGRNCISRCPFCNWRVCVPYYLEFLLQVNILTFAN